MIPARPDTPRKVVPAGNIRQLFLFSRQPSRELSLQWRHGADDDHCAVLAARGRPRGVLCGAGADNQSASGKGSTKVTIYTRLDCKLCDGVREVIVLNPRAYIPGAAARIAARGMG